MTWVGVVAFVAFVLGWNWWTGARYFRMLGVRRRHTPRR